MKKSTGFLLPIILVTSLFFLWGLAYGLLDVLNKHFQETLNITKQRSTLLQAAYFGAYFIIALPAGLFMQKIGYRKGIITGFDRGLYVPYDNEFRIKAEKWIHNKTIGKKTTEGGEND